jgi:hypothetical protein
VERTDRPGFDREHSFNASCHFLGSLLREGDGQDTMRPEPFLPDEITYLVRKDFGLAAARARQKQKGRAEVLDRGFLFLVQPCQHFLGG